MTSTTLPASGGRISYAPLWISFLVAIAYGTPQGVLNVAWGMMSTELVQSYDQLGVLLTAALVGRFSMTLFGGQVTARLGVWRCMALGLSGMVLGFVLYATAATWEMLLLGATLTALGAGVMDIGLTLTIVSRYRAGTLNWMHAAFGVGLIIGPLLVTFVTSMQWGWRAAYLFPLALSGVGLLAILLTRREWLLPTASQADSKPTKAASMPATLAMPSVWWWMAIGFVYGGLEVGVGQLTGDTLISERGVDAVTASTWISLYWGAFTIGRVLTSFLSRVPQYILMRLYAGGIVLGMLILNLPGAPAALIALLVLGASMAGFFPTHLTLLPGRVGPAHAPNALGFTISAVSIGLTVLPGYGAALAAAHGFAVVPGYFLIWSVVLLVMMVLTRPRTPSPA